MTSERPEGLNPLEREEYELAIEEQAYPFENKAIAVHESNLELISRGVYNEWVEKSLQKLAVLVPARYDKPEEASGLVTSPDTFVFVKDNPVDSAQPESEPGATGDKDVSGEGMQVQVLDTATGDEPAEPEKAQDLEMKTTERAAR